MFLINTNLKPVLEYVEQDNDLKQIVYNAVHANKKDYSFAELLHVFTDADTYGVGKLNTIFIENNKINLAKQYLAEKLH